MYVELVESLRCPRPHEAMWLVAIAAATAERHIVAGTLGCPVCEAEYPIERGVAHFEGDAPVAVVPPPADDPERALRLAAFLDLTDARGFALVAGRWVHDAAALADLAPTPLLVVNPPTSLAMGERLSGLATAGVVPVVPGSARAAALDLGLDPALLQSLVEGVRSGGRIAAPAELPIPEGVRELARDASWWVGERAGGAGASPLVPLRARRRDGQDAGG